MRLCFLLFISFLFAIKASAQWVNTTSGTNVKLNDVYFLNSNKGFVVGENLTLRKTNNGAASWMGANIDLTGLSASGSIKKIDFGSNTVGIVAGNLGNGYVFLRTTDGGSNWSKLPYIASGGTTINSFSFLFDSTKLLAVGTNGTLLYSASGGDVWVPLSISGLSADITDVSFAFGTTFICADNGAIYKASDVQAQWSIIKQPDSVSLKSIVALNNDTIMAIGQTSNGSYLISSYNGGSSWLPPLNMQVENINDIYFTNNLTGFAVGGSPTLSTNSQYIATTNDAGFTWQQQNEATLRQLNAVFFVDALTGFAVGDSGTVIKTNNGGITGIQDKVLAASVKVFPIPANGLLSIISEKEAVSSIMVFDVTGKEHFIYAQKPVTDNLYQLDIAELPSGFYYLNILFKNGNRGSKKIIRE